MRADLRLGGGRLLRWLRQGVARGALLLRMGGVRRALLAALLFAGAARAQDPRRPLSGEDAELVKELALLEKLDLVKNLELFEKEPRPERGPPGKLHEPDEDDDDPPPPPKR